MRFAEHDFVRRHGGFALRDIIQFQFDAGGRARAHLATGARQTGGAHVLDADHETFLHGFQTCLQQKLFHEWVADLHVGPLCARIFTETGRGHGRAVDAVSSGLRADIDHGIADAVRSSVKNFVLFKDSECERIHERVLRVAIRKNDFTPHGRHAKTVSVKSDAADHAFHNSAVLALMQRTKPQAVHGGDWTGAHREDVAKYAADAGGRALKRLDERRVIMGLDLEGDRQPGADIDDSRVLARPLQNRRTARRKPLQVDARALVAAMFAPHDAEYPKLGKRGFAFEDRDDPFVFGFGEIVLCEYVFSDHMPLAALSSVIIVH